MSTPICDFVRRHIQSRPVRFHMPGHKGEPLLGFEPLDITEIDGADELFTAHGIIAESEAQASVLFGAHTVYATGGSTLCIQTMLHLTALYAASKGERPRILAARNAHKAFINAAALLDLEVQWLYPEAEDNTYVSCPVSPEEVRRVLTSGAECPTAVYLTSPDYLGNIQDIHGIAEVCHQCGILLLVDNAHGAYLKFLPQSRHPMDLGADMCCDSAHKTLGVVTGGAYLHISPTAPQLLRQQAKASMSLFGSSSPSYLILQSLDAANDQMMRFQERLAAFLPRVSVLKAQLAAHGLPLIGDEPLKITLSPKAFGYTGTQIANLLEEHHMFPEFYDPDYVVLMLSPANCEEDLAELERVLCNVRQKPPICVLPPVVPHPERVLTPRCALMRDSEILPLEQCSDRISAAAAISCPPAIPIAVCGERIDRQVLDCLRYYDVSACAVVKE